MKKFIGMVAVFAFLGPSLNSVGSSNLLTLPSCLQDQYGNQYTNLIADSVHGIITGTVISNQGCSTDTISMLGSWSTNSSGQTTMELTVADNTTDSVCVPIYKLRGPYPYANWYYTFPNNLQPFRFAACSADSQVINTEKGGARGPE